MVLRCLRAELMKCRRAPVWLAFLVLPLFPAVLGTFNYLGNLEVLDAGWYSLWTQHTLFASMFFLPAQFGVFCAWQWRLEHADHNWNAALTAPVPVRALYLGKLLLDVGVSALAMALIGLLFLLSGRLAGISAPLPPELPGWLAFGALGCTAVCAVQLYLSLAIRAFAPPVAIALVGAVVPTDMHMNDRRARIIRALGLSYHLLHGVGDSGAVFLGDLRAADGCGNDEFFHHSHFLS